MRRLAILLLTKSPALLVLGSVAAAGVLVAQQRVAQHQVAPASGPASVAAGSALVDRGRQLYLVTCSSFHGSKAGGTSQGPSLNGVGAAAADFQLSTGRMPLADPNGQPVRKPPALTRAQIDAVVAYIASLGRGPAIPKVDVHAGDLSAGGSLFRLNCAACHSSTGAGGALSYGFDAPKLDQATPVQIGEAMRTGPGQMPIFGPSAFSGRQVDSIARYVGYLQDPHDPGGFALGRIGPITEGMVALLLGIPLLLFICGRIEEAHERKR